jgi:hypothetical protein
LSQAHSTLSQFKVTIPVTMSLTFVQLATDLAKAILKKLFALSATGVENARP